MVIFNRNLRGLGARIHPRFFQDAFTFSMCLLENAFLAHFRRSRVDFWPYRGHVMSMGLKDINFGLELTKLHLFTAAGPSQARVATRRV